MHEGQRVRSIVIVLKIIMIEGLQGSINATCYYSKDIAVVFALHAGGPALMSGKCNNLSNLNHIRE